MKIKIASDGTLYGTSVVNAETNEAIDNITSIDWHVHAARGRAIADVTIKALNIPLEFAGEGKVEKVSSEGRVAELEKEQK